MTFYTDVDILILSEEDLIDSSAGKSIEEVDLDDFDDTALMRKACIVIYRQEKTKILKNKYGNKGIIENG